MNAITNLKIQLGDKTIELTADEARKLFVFLSDLFQQDNSSTLPHVPLPPWNIPIVIPPTPVWPHYPQQPWFGDPILPGPTCGSMSATGGAKVQCLNAVL